MRCDLCLDICVTFHKNIPNLQEENDVVNITGTVEGFTTSVDGAKHGFHIHEMGNKTNDCDKNGGHYNPDNKNHGSPTATARWENSFIFLVCQIKRASSKIIFIDTTTKICQHFLWHRDELDCGK